MTFSNGFHLHTGTVDEAREWAAAAGISRKLVLSYRQVKNNALRGQVLPVSTITVDPASPPARADELFALATDHNTIVGMTREASK